jgi:hypothetical protein
MGAVRGEVAGMHFQLVAEACDAVAVEVGRIVRGG